MSEIDELMNRIRKRRPLLDQFMLEDEDWALLLGEIERLRAERRKLFDLMSEWKHPLFQLRMQVISLQGRIDGQIHDVRKEWFEEHGYVGDKD